MGSAFTDTKNFIYKKKGQPELPAFVTLKYILGMDYNNLDIAQIISKYMGYLSEEMIYDLIFICVPKSNTHYNQFIKKNKFNMLDGLTHAEQLKYRDLSNEYKDETERKSKILSEWE